MSASGKIPAESTSNYLTAPNSHFSSSPLREMGRNMVRSTNPRKLHARLPLPSPRSRSLPGRMIPSQILTSFSSSSGTCWMRSQNLKNSRRVSPPYTRTASRQLASLDFTPPRTRATYHRLPSEKIARTSSSAHLFISGQPDDAR